MAMTPHAMSSSIPTPVASSPTLSTPSALPAGLADGDALPLSWLQDHVLVERLLEALWSARQPATPAQFFVWSQSRLQPLLPHRLLVCVGDQPPSPRLTAQLFHLKPIGDALQAQLEAPDHGLWLHLIRRWGDGRRPLHLDLTREAPSALFQPLLEAGLRDVALHGVAGDGERPQSLFLLAGDGWEDEHLRRLELLTPSLHAAWRRARLQPRGQAAPRRAGALVTPREQQIVEGLRAGLSNEGIAIQLGISMFTVKNHVRKILRKLGANNRAQAVAIAMSRREFSEPEPPLAR
ncbi:helix-turn-helix transcriptional regulator [Mitsuaria sp. GD03876]|uniref:helix-turn-helix transcriptional regulator n=1 Tax=Mitsuaria sp. GD03876 TaxID=2975399 RepID=UPI00244AC7E7|nr:helix-turn-helix transcriptional regulator [Mitsuaria sp. GD03876]MDH0866723.1 helix-turn-helix transcriptional regulator [Mitsuaria sp. GD03876]